MVDTLADLAPMLILRRLYRRVDHDIEGALALQASGLDLEHIHNVHGAILRANVTFLANGQFEIDSFGEAAFVTHIDGDDAESVVDIVAWCCCDPPTFGTMFGSGVLGLDRLLNPASYVGHPCPIFATPYAWFQARCEGAAILDYRAARKALHAAPGPLAPDSLEFAESLLRAGIVTADRLMIPSTWRVAA